MVLKIGGDPIINDYMLMEKSEQKVIPRNVEEVKQSQESCNEKKKKV